VTIAAEATGDEPEMLRKAVTSALQAAVDCQIASLALPLLSSGIFGCPVFLAADIAVAAVIDFLQQIGPESDDYLQVLLHPSCGTLCCAVLCCTMCCAVLCCAVLCCAVLCCAALRCATLYCALRCGAASASASASGPCQHYVEQLIAACMLAPKLVCVLPGT